LIPIVQQVASVFQEFAPKLIPVIQLIGTDLTAALSQILPEIMPIIPQLLSLAEAVDTTLLNAIVQLMPVINELIQAAIQLLPQIVQLIPPIVQLVQQLLPLIPPLVKIAAVIVENVIPALEPLISLILRLVDDVFVRFAQGVHNTVVAAQQFGRDVAAAFTTAKDTVVTSWDNVVSFIGGLPRRFASAGAHMWDWVKDTFRSAINTVIGWWNSLHFNLPKVSTPLGDIGGGSIGVPSIPYLAAGGTAVAGGLAWVGEKGPELIQMQAGARVISNPDSRALLGASGPSDHFTATITMKSPDGREIDKQLVTFQRQGGVLESVKNGAKAVYAAGGR